LRGGANSNMVGGGAGLGNLVQACLSDGILLQDNTTSHNTIQGNTVGGDGGLQNGGGGIHLSDANHNLIGAGGLGGAIARGVSEAGAKVFLADLDLPAAEKVARSIRKKKKRPCRACRMDILNPAQINEAMLFSRQSFGGMDVAINCIGINIRKLGNKKLFYFYATSLYPNELTYCNCINSI
jgi:shikimate 5-dehydrogenase